MIKHTASFVEHAKVFMNDLFLVGKLSDVDKKTGGFRYGNILRIRPKDVEIICKEIVDKDFNFMAVDDALLNLANLKPLCAVSLSSNRAFKVDGNAGIIAQYIAWFCSEADFIWDDTKYTEDERKQFQEYTTFGGALAEAELFKSIIDAKTNKSATTTTTAATSKAPNKNTSGQPINNYKSTGGQSANARGLVGAAGNKITLNGTYGFVYAVTFDKKGANTPNLYVAPLDNKGDAGNNINKVLEGSANGYTDCTCYFNTPSDADTFMSEYVKKHNLAQNSSGGYDSAKYLNLKVTKSRINNNGYFEVETECGRCYINAKKLNEGVELKEAEITPEIAKEVETAAKKDSSYKIFDIDVYEEAFNRYL